MEEEKYHSRTSWKSLEKGEDIQRQETGGRGEAFSLLGNFCTRQTNEVSVKFNMSSYCSNFRSPNSFIHVFIHSVIN